MHTGHVYVASLQVGVLWVPVPPATGHCVWCRTCGELFDGAEPCLGVEHRAGWFRQVYGNGDHRWLRWWQEEAGISGEAGDEGGWAGNLPDVADFAAGVGSLGRKPCVCVLR